MPFDRASGVLLHITSLPSNGGIGDLGQAAYDFADFLATGKQKYWQVLPLSPTGYGNSPYAALSAFAGNPLLISLERLAEWGWISPDRLVNLPGSSGKVQFDQVVDVQATASAGGCSKLSEQSWWERLWGRALVAF